MFKSLTIADNLKMASIVNLKFTEAGWANQAINFPTILSGNSNVAGYSHCIVLVVDVGFKERFGCSITEISSMVKNLSKYAPLYLVFEGEYDQCYESWLECAKKIFKADLYDQQLHNAIDEIICSESKLVPRESFVSPMG